MATSGMDSTQAQAVVAASVGQQAFPTFGGASTGKLKFIGSGATETVNGTEITPGGSYVAGGVAYTPASTFGAPSYSAGNASTTNSGAAITQTNMPAVASPGVQQAEIWDTAATPKRWWFGALTSAVITNSGDTLTFATSSITVTYQI